MANQLYRRVPRLEQPPQTQTLNLVEFRAELRVQINKGLHAPSNTVALLRPPPGTGKTFIASDELARLPDGMSVAVFCQTHELAKAEWQERIAGSLRLMSLGQMAEEQTPLGVDPASGQPVQECPCLNKIQGRQARGLPYFRACCLGRCPLLGECRYHLDKKAARDKQVIIGQFAHLPTITHSGLLDGRVIIFDECPAAWLRSKVLFSPRDMESFKRLLSEFQATGEADPEVLDSLHAAMAAIEAIPMGESRKVPDPGGILSRCDAFRAKFSRFLDEACAAGRNLLRDLMDAAVMRRPVRRTRGADSHCWTVRPNLPPNDRPIMVLDATGTVELYQELFPGREIRVWPEEYRYAPRSVVTTFADGSYCQKSLWDTTDPKSPKPSKGFGSIMDHVAKTIQFHGGDTKTIGFVTLLKLVQAIMAKFPDVPKEHVLHYGDLRGRNELKSCPLVFIIGCQGISVEEVAENAVTMFGLDCDPKSLIGDLGQQRQFQPMGSSEFDAQQFSFRNKYLRLAWQAVVTAEVAQAAGRCRAYEERQVVQRVFAFTNIDIGMPATQTTTKAEHLKSMGFAATKADHLALVIRQLASEKQPFGYKQISELSGIPLKGLKAPRYQQVIKQVVEAMGVAVTGKPARFEEKKEDANAA